VLTGLGIYAVIHPHGDFQMSAYQTPRDITPSKEAGHTVITQFPTGVLLGDPGPLSRYSVTFSNPLIAEYTTYYKGTQDYPALIPQNIGRTKVTIKWASQTIEMTLVVRLNKAHR
jgi:hypothetical protein